MGYIIIDEEKFEEAINYSNNRDYKVWAKADIREATVDLSHILKVIQQSEQEIDERIRILESKKKDIKKLLEYAKGEN